MRELHFREFRLNLYSLEFSLCATVTRERQQILIAEMQLKFVQIRLERNGSAGAKIVALAAGFVSHFAQVVLAQVGKREGTAAMANSGRVDAPEIDVFALRSRDHRIYVGIKRPPSATEIVNTRRNEQERAATARVWPTLQPIKYRKVGTGTRS